MSPGGRREKSGTGLTKSWGFIWPGKASNIYVSRRQEGEVRCRLDKVLGFILSRQRVFFY
jgi:hypothetical protein